MTTVVEMLTRAARQCSVNAPSSWLTSTDDDHSELRDVFMPDTVDDILERVDVPSPVGKQVTITGTGVVNYALPSDFKRLVRDNSAVYDEQLDRIILPITSDGQWTYLRDVGTTGIARYYRLAGYEGNLSLIHI